MKFKNEANLYGFSSIAFSGELKLIEIKPNCKMNYIVCHICTIIRKNSIKEEVVVIINESYEIKEQLITLKRILSNNDLLIKQLTNGNIFVLRSQNEANQINIVDITKSMKKKFKNKKDIISQISDRQRNIVKHSIIRNVCNNLKSIPVYTYCDAVTKIKPSGCFVILSDGKIGFCFKRNFSVEYCIKFDQHTAANNFLNITYKNYKPASLLKLIKSSEVLLYGPEDHILDMKINRRIDFLQKELNYQIFYESFFKKLYELREDKRISVYYKMLFNARDEASFMDSYKITVRQTLKYILNPELLEKPLINLEEFSKISITKKEWYFDYSKYTDTCGIFYTLNNEEKIFEDCESINASCKFLNKFAYIPNSEKLKSIISFLIVYIDLSLKIIKFEYYKEKKYFISFPIKVYEYSFVPDVNAVSEIEKIFFNITKLVSERINNYYDKPKIYDSSVYYKSTYSNRTIEKQPYCLESTLKINDEVKKFSNLEKIPINRMNEIFSSKGMHYRRGHWHYYWYGSYDSPNRHKELRWVNEVIVNRNSHSIILEL